jgi:RNA polymerase subunit RPABC4/transcription elongation factor Spt4
MGKLVLAYDEVILLEDSEITYSGSVEGLDYLDKLTLTNKRIIAQWTKKKEDNILNIQFSDIKKYMDELQVDYYNDEEHGECLRIQTINGIELFNLNGIDGESLANTFKRMVSSKSKSNEYRAIIIWVEKIKEAAPVKKANNQDEVQKASVVVPTIEKKVVETTEEFNECSDCGEKFDKFARFCPSCGTSAKKTKIVEVEKVVEVIRCRKCGQKMGSETKFCPSCGTSVIEEARHEASVPPVVDEKKARDKKVHKCPICGEFLPSDALKCPSCNNEIRGREAVTSVSEFFHKISSIEDENKKIEAIKMYPIPNNKEDITEFMFLACSNFDAKYYATNKQGDSIANAWYTKIEQCYKKAVMMFTDSADIQKIEKLYKEIQVTTSTIKRDHLVMTVTGIALIIISVFLMGLSPTAEDGSAASTPLSYVSMAMLAIGIIVLVKGLKKKKTNKQIEEEKIAKMYKKNRR